LAACSPGNQSTFPSDPYIDLIEQRLEQHPCVGNLNEWERNYRFAKPSGLSAYTAQANFDVIEFHLRRAGSTRISPGRNVFTRGEQDDWPDSKGIGFLDGSYKIGERSLRMPRCTRYAVGA